MEAKLPPSPIPSFSGESLNRLPFLARRFRMFCQWTGLHGWNLLAEPGQSTFHMVFWLAVIVISIVSGCLLVSWNISDFVRSAVSYDLDTPTHPLDDVFFPSMVLCNFNRLRSSLVWALLNDEDVSNTSYHELHQLIEKNFVKGQDVELGDHEKALLKTIMDTSTLDGMFRDMWVQSRLSNLSNTRSNLPIYNFHPLQEVNETELDVDSEKLNFFVNLATQFRHGEMILRMHFTGVGHLVDLGFASDVSDTCTWITPLAVEPPELYFNHVKRYARNGVNNGLQLLLDAETFDYASPLQSKEGFVFTILHQLDIAILKQTGSIAMPGQAVQVAITPILTNTTMSAKRRFSPTDRQCYFEDEIKLAHLPVDVGYRYEMTNCLYEAALQKIGKDCNCIPASFAKYLPTSLNMCMGKMKLCMISIMQDIGSKRIIDDGDERKECLAACEDQSHQFLVTTSAFPNEQSFYVGDDFCLVLDKVKISCQNEKKYSLSITYPKLCPAVARTSSLTCNEIIASGVNTSGQALKEQVSTYARTNLVLLDIYIRDPYVKLFIRREKITVISFVGTIGGLLGLFLGFSCMSVIEVFYIFVFGMGERSYRFQRRDRAEQAGQQKGEADLPPQLKKALWNLS